MSQTSLREAMRLRCERLIKNGVPAEVAINFVQLAVGLAWAQGVTDSGAVTILEHACRKALKSYAAAESWESLRKSRFEGAGIFRPGILNCITQAVNEHLAIRGPDPDLAPDAECPVPIALLEVYRAYLDLRQGQAAVIRARHSKGGTVTGHLG